MLEKRLLEEILGIAVSTGADFAEVYCELTRNGRVVLMGGKIETIADNTVSGVGIRAFLGTRTVYGSTSDMLFMISCDYLFIGGNVWSQSIKFSPRSS